MGHQTDIKQQCPIGNSSSDYLSPVTQGKGIPKLFRCCLTVERELLSLATFWPKIPGQTVRSQTVRSHSILHSYKLVQWKHAHRCDNCVLF